MDIRKEARPFQKCISIDLEIGESPVWDDARNVLWFVDIVAPAIYALNPTTQQLATHPMPAAVGSVGLALHGRLIVALRTGVHLYDPTSRSLEFLVHPEPDATANRLNDGKVGPDGAFWVGSMHDATPREPTGALYRVAPDGRCARIFDGLFVSNGLAWSPDGRTMYHADTRRAVTAHAFDPATGSLSGARSLAYADPDAGLPDGAATDVEGYYWSAGVTAGRINKIAPFGTVEAYIPVPTPAPTMPCFGGPDLRTMFVTSLATSRGGERAGGTLISCRMDVPGVAVGRFGERQ